MEYIKWIDAKYSVGIKKFDDQHQKLVEIINEVFAAKMNYSTNAVIQNILDRLEDYIKSHFTDEELFLKELNYPRFEEHRKEHRYFTTKISEFRQAFTRNEASVNEEILGFLKDWLLSHIMKDDKEYGAFVHDQTQS